MPEVMKTLLLNPPSFEKFDGGAGSRWPVAREIESYWYPVWLSFPAGMLPGSRLVDACPHKISWAETVEISRSYEFLVLFTSTVGFESDLRLIREMKEKNPGLKICFVGPHVQNTPDQSLMASPDVDFIVRGEFDHAVVELAEGKPLDQILGISYKKDGRVVHNGLRPPAPHRRTGRAAVCHGGLQAATSRSKTTTCRSCCIRIVSLYTTPGVPCAVYVLPVAADDFRACLARAFERTMSRAKSPSDRILPTGQRVLLRRRHVQHSQGSRTGNLREVQAAEVPLVGQCARAQRLRDAESHG